MFSLQLLSGPERQSGHQMSCKLTGPYFTCSMDDTKGGWHRSWKTNLQIICSMVFHVNLVARNARGSVKLVFSPGQQNRLHIHSMGRNHSSLLPIRNFDARLNTDVHEIFYLASDRRLGDLEELDLSWEMSHEAQFQDGCQNPEQKTLNKGLLIFIRILIYQDLDYRLHWCCRRIALKHLVIFLTSCMSPRRAQWSHLGHVPTYSSQQGPLCSPNSNLSFLSPVACRQNSLAKAMKGFLQLGFPCTSYQSLRALSHWTHKAAFPLKTEHVLALQIQTPHPAVLPVLCSEPNCIQATYANSSPFWKRVGLRWKSK